MNIFKHEFKMYRKSIIIWSLSVAGLLFVYMGFFPSLSDQSGALEQIMDNYPEEMLKAIGLGSGLSISNIFGFFTLTFTFVQLALAIQSANYGFSILSIEERELTADFLMSKPVSRRRIISSKFFAAFLALFITNIAVWVGSLLALELFNDGQGYSARNAIMLLSIVPVFQLFFLSVGMLISVSVRKIRSVLSYSMALGIGMYAVNAIRSIIGGEVLGYITPYYHFEPGYILQNGEYDLSMVFISGAVIIVSLIVSYILYTKRDIHSL